MTGTLKLAMLALLAGVAHPPAAKKLNVVATTPDLAAIARDNRG